MRIIKKEYGQKTVLAFSRGKDSIGCWIALRRAGFEVYPYHNMICPGLSFIDESLDYYERFFGVHIRRIPHPTLYRYLNDSIMQTPMTAAVIAGCELPEFDSIFTERLIVEEEGMPEGTPAAIGMRVYDNLTRRVWLIQHGPIQRKRFRYCPIWDWRKERLISEITKAGVKLPIDYEMVGRSFDGITLKYIWQIKKRFPADYKILLEWFPLAEVEIWRYEHYGKGAHAR